MVVACHVCMVVVAGHESEQGALAIQVASKQDNKHSLYLTLLLQLKQASLLFINYPIHTHILIRIVEPHIYETPAYNLGLQQYPVTSGSLSHITALSTIVGVQLNLVTTGAELETNRMGFSNYTWYSISLCTSVSLR